MEDTGTYYETDTMQDDTDAGMFAYVMAHVDEFKIHQVIHAFS